MYAFPSPHSGILFLYEDASCGVTVVVDGFRPLIRGFFFYGRVSSNALVAGKAVSVPSFGDSFFIMKISSIIGKLIAGFPSPHSGILFLWINMKISSVIGKCFRPLIRGFFFYPHYDPDTANNGGGFPSPHSGILFL